jgi:ATP-citrate lyase beta-subunit
MSRVKITEYRAKKLLLGDAYKGIAVTSGGVASRGLPNGRYVVKVDQGVKQRYKKGLLFLDQSAVEVPKAIAALKKKGYSRFLVEPYSPHDVRDEQYLSFERVRGGVRIMHAKEGGVEIESHPEKVTTVLLSQALPYMVVPGVSKVFLKRCIKVFEDNYFSFLEINPLVGDTPLDAAVLVDSAAAFFTDGWSEDDIVKAKTKHPAEEAVAELQKTSPASFKLTVLNPDGSLFFLLSGGGGSIVIADEAALAGYGKEIGNYGEYSGGPTREETYLYAKEVIALMLSSKGKALRQAQGKKALVIAGGIANFTDIRTTFLGIIDALTESATVMRKAGIKVYVRRGGPHEDDGLALMRAFLEKEKLLGAVYGSDVIITKAVDDAL